MNYWEECIAEALDDADLKASKEQIQNIAGWVEGAHENYGMAFGHDCIQNPQTLEIEALQKALKKERDKILCGECKGAGRITEHGPVHSYNSECTQCRGEGRYNL